MAPIKQTVSLPDDVALKLRLESAVKNTSQQEIMLAAIRAALNEDKEEHLSDAEMQVQAIINLLQTLETGQLLAIFEELRRMVSVPKRRRKTTDPSGQKEK